MYIPADKAAWRARTDGNEPDVWRWHQVLKFQKDGAAGLPALAQGQKGLALVGFASDEGVVRNLGRVGAAEGPQALRQFCAGMPVHFDAEQHLLADLGTIVCYNQDLELAHAELGQQLASAQAKGYFTLVFGGGHEVTYGQWLGVRPGLQAGQGVGIVNFDAHYDLRDLTDGQRHSGNSFTAIAQDCQANGRSFAYAALGIQRMGNTRRLFNRADEMGVYTVMADEMGGAALGQVSDQLAHWLHNHHPQMLTIDMDVFSASLAPGVSAPNAIGILPGPGAMRLLRQVLACPSLRSADIAELNPRFDVDNRTARLGAAIAFEVAAACLA